MSDIRKQPYRLNIDSIPKELLDLEFQCPDCKHKSKASWLSKKEFPSQPVSSNPADGHWVPVSIKIECLNKECTKIFDYKVPALPREAIWSLYGDEAERIIRKNENKYSNDDLSFFCITLVCCHNSKQDILKQKINELKKSIVPNENPENWTHHFKEIWSPSKKNKSKFDLSKLEKIEYANKFAKILRDNQPELVIFNFSGALILPENIIERKKHLKYQKENIFSLSLLSSLQQMRNQNKTVEWIFDFKKDSTKKNRTEGWASETFLGLQYTNLLTWISSGATVLEPKFVQPGSHFLLEIADFCSFWIAREFAQSIKKTKIELSSNKIGRVFFQANKAIGDVEYKWTKNGMHLKGIYGLDRIKDS